MDGHMAKVFWRTHSILERISNYICYKVRVSSLLIFCILGFSSVLLDTDHFISEIFKMSRPLHLPIFIVMWIVCICYGAYMHRRFHKASVEVSI